MKQTKTMARRLAITITTGFFLVLILSYLYIEDMREGLARISDEVACRFNSDLCVQKKQALKGLFYDAQMFVKGHLFRKDLFKLLFTCRGIFHLL